MALTPKGRQTLVALARATEGAAPLIVRDVHGATFAVPDVALHSDQGIYRADGAQRAFRRGARSYVLVRRVRTPPAGWRLVLLDQRFSCGSITLSDLVREGYLMRAADAMGFLLSERGRDEAARARCTCGHPLEAHTAAGCTYPAPAGAHTAICPCPYHARPVLIQTPQEPA
jgi:hypothetical protein